MTLDLQCKRSSHIDKEFWTAYKAICLIEKSGVLKVGRKILGNRLNSVQDLILHAGTINEFLD